MQGYFDAGRISGFAMRLILVQSEHSDFSPIKGSRASVLTWQHSDSTRPLPPEMKWFINKSYFLSLEQLPCATPLPHTQEIIKLWNSPNLSIFLKADAISWPCNPLEMSSNNVVMIGCFAWSWRMSKGNAGCRISVIVLLTFCSKQCVRWDQLKADKRKLLSTFSSCQSLIFSRQYTLTLERRESIKYHMIQQTLYWGIADEARNLNGKCMLYI